MKEENQLIKQRIQKLNNLKARGINPYPYSFDQKDHASIILNKFKKLKKDKKTNSRVSVAGRIITLRIMGKAGFAHVQDETGKIQIYVREDVIGKENYKIFSKSDLGDIIGVSGNIFCTKKGEISIWVKNFELLSKSIRPLPEKWHGLKDTEIRYRKRYLDLIVNPEIKEVFIKRAKIIEMIREFLSEYNFLEVETPLLQPNYGGASARPFKTHLNFLDMDLFLAISPELYLKRLIVGGFERVYTICKNFRNEGIDTMHNPEFTMLEFYYAYANYEKLMKMTEKLIPKLVKEINKNYRIRIGNENLNFKPPYRRVRFRDFILKETGIDIDKVKDFENLKKEIIKRNIPNVNVNNLKHYGALMDELYKRVCRPRIIQPTFLTHYPVEMIALAKRNEKDPSKINTFQLLVNGAEIVKAYDELNDPIDQRERLEEQQKILRGGSEEAMPMDEDFVDALEVGMPPTAGYGLGIDRLMMLLTGNDSIKDVILFPFMKSSKENKKSL